jgi:two-component sensor histidine kinase
LSSPTRVSSSLALNLSASIILWVLLTMVAILVFLIWEARQTAEQQVELEGELIGSVAASACVQPLLEHDYPTIRTRLEAMVKRLPDVVFFQVDSALPGSVGVEVSIGEQASLKRWIDGDSEGMVVFQAPIMSADISVAPIGEVAIGYSRDRIDAALMRQIRTISFGIGLSFFFVAIFLIFIVRRIIGTPLADLDAQSARLAGGDLETPVRLESQTEFGHLAQALESMRVRVAGQIQHLEELSEKLVHSSEVQRMMFSELDHRVRNNLAGLVTLINLSRRGAVDIDSFANSIGSRVHAMSVVHTLLSQEHWEPVSFELMVRMLVPPGVRGTLEIEDSEKILIPTNQATACGMVMQELMANSLKYGAWSQDGCVHIHWNTPVRQVDGRMEVEWVWRESGGPVLGGEIQPGTGTGLIKGFVTTELKGSVDLNYEPAGAHHNFVFRFGLKQS